MTIYASNADYETLDDVIAQYPEAEAIIATENGWNVFESAQDYDTWYDYE